MLWRESRRFGNPIAVREGVWGGEFGPPPPQFRCAWEVGRTRRIIGSLATVTANIAQIPRLDKGRFAATLAQTGHGPDVTHTSPPRTLTLRDVSEASGVSEMTVSRVLRQRGDVSDATRARVLDAARRLGYVPNKIAGALASQRVNLVGVIVPSLSNMVFPEVLSGISEILDDTGLQPVFGVTNYSPEREEAVLYEMLSWRPSGMILAGLEHTPAAGAMLARAGIPVVEIMDIDGAAIDSAVGISHRRAGRHMAEAILAAGYRNIAFLGTMMPHDHRARKRPRGRCRGSPPPRGRADGGPRVLLGRLGAAEGPRDDRRRACPQPAGGFSVLFQRYDRRGGAFVLP
jgi:hypothetical protein